jgi:hypothetical protein
LPRRTTPRGRSQQLSAFQDRRGNYQMHSPDLPRPIPMEATALRIRVRETADRDFARRTDRGFLRRLIVFVVAASSLSILAPLRADIPWPEVVQRLAQENEKLARRPQGHNGEYFVVCTLYYTPMESGFTFERGFDATPVTKPGLHGHTYPRDFLRSVRKEGFGRIITPVNGRDYIHYNGGASFAFASRPTGGGGSLLARFSAAAKPGQSGLRHGVIIETPSSTVYKIFGSTRWKIVDSGGGLRRWQIDLYYGEDEPLGPGRFMARPRGTTFEYAYSEGRISK